MAEDEILALARRVDLRRKVALMAVLLGMVAVGAGLSQFSPGDPERFPPRVLEAVLGGGGLVILIGVVTMLVSRTPIEARSGRIAMIRAEGMRAKRNVAFMLMPLSLGLMLMGVIQALNRANGGNVEHIQIFVICAFIFFLVAAGAG